MIAMSFFLVLSCSSPCANKAYLLNKTATKRELFLSSVESTSDSDSWTMSWICRATSFLSRPHLSSCGEGANSPTAVRQGFFWPLRVDGLHVVAPEHLISRSKLHRTAPSVSMKLQCVFVTVLMIYVTHQIESSKSEESDVLKTQPKNDAYQLETRETECVCKEHLLNIYQMTCTT